MDPYAPFADIYEEWSAPMTDDVAFYADLACEADGPVVELAVGSGRVAVPVAKAIGGPVLGIDRSPAMWKARSAAEEAGVDLELERAKCSIRARERGGAHLRPYLSLLTYDLATAARLEGCAALQPAALC